MSKNNYDLEQRADEILKAFAEEMGANNEAFVKAFLDEEQPDPPMFRESTEPETPDIKPRGSRRVLRRTLILVAVLILVMGLVVCTSEGVRLKLSSLFFGDAPGSTRVLDDSNLVVDLESVELGYVPEGFEVVSDEMFMGLERNIIYTDSQETTFVLTITKTEQYVNNIDNERGGNEEILINDKQGYLFANQNRYSLVWQIGDCICQVSSEMDKSILLQIAEGVIVN